MLTAFFADEDEDELERSKMFVSRGKESGLWRKGEAKEVGADDAVPSDPSRHLRLRFHLKLQYPEICNCRVRAPPKYLHLTTSLKCSTSRLLYNVINTTSILTVLEVSEIVLHAS